MAVGRIPDTILDDILNRVDIVELISGYIPLKRSGRNFKAPCPFHHEKTPSFMVSPERQIYHCFGCGAGGNAIGFLVKYERLEFLEAVALLAKKAGIILPERQKEDPQTISFISQLYKLNEISALFYRDILNSTGGLSAKLYLEKRGIKDETIKLFQLGAAADRWDMLMNYLRAKNINLSLIEKAGLILSREGGGYYDRFRNRIIFPIFDIKSRVLGFGARVLDNTLPKYINSPETAVYVKGRHLYGLNFSKDSIRESDYVLIVEGYLDFIIPFQAGFKNIVASLGTALTVEQARLLKRYTNNVVMLYDADKAGEIATLRSLDIFIEEGMHVKVVSLPLGFDPDLFMRKNGLDSFKLKIQQAQGLFEYKLTVLKSRYNPQEIEGKVKIASEMLSTINKFKNAVSKSEYIKRLAESLGVGEDALLQELKKTKEIKPDFGRMPEIQARELAINPTEKLLIKLMLEESGLIHRIKDDIEPADFQDSRTSRIASILFDLAAQGKKIEPNLLASHIGEDEILRVICESTFMPDVSLEDKDRIVDDCIRRLKLKRIKMRRQHLHEQIKSAQHLGDEEKLHSLLEEFHHLIKRGE
jgi:DNA primase